MTVSIGYPDRENERLIMQKHTSKMQTPITFNESSNLKTLQEMQKKVVEIHVDDSLREYIRDLVYITRSDKRLLIGVSPRGSCGGRAIPRACEKEETFPQSSTVARAHVSTMAKSRP